MAPVSQELEPPTIPARFSQPLPLCLRAEIRRQLGRLDAVVRDLATVEAERNGLVGLCPMDRPAQSPEEGAEPGGVPEAVTIPGAQETGSAVAPEAAASSAASEAAPAHAASETAPAEPAALLMTLKGIGPEFAAVLWLEALFRSFGNRRQIAAYAGLAPVPWQSGGIDRDQGKGGQSAAAQDDDPGRLAVDPPPAGIGDQPMVRQARRDGARAYAPDRHRRRGSQAAGRVVALRHPGRRSGGRRPEGLRSHTRAKSADRH